MKKSNKITLKLQSGKRFDTEDILVNNGSKYKYRVDLSPSRSGKTRKRQKKGLCWTMKPHSTFKSDDGVIIENKMSKNLRVHLSRITPK